MNRKIVLFIPAILGIVLLVVSFIDILLFNSGYTLVRAMLTRELPIVLLGFGSTGVISLYMLVLLLQRNWKAAAMACASSVIFTICFVLGGIFGGAYLNAT